MFTVVCNKETNIPFYLEPMNSIFFLGMCRNQNLDIVLGREKLTTLQAFRSFFCRSFSPFLSYFILWFCWPLKRLRSHWKSFHLNIGESELLQQRVSMVEKVAFFGDFGGKIPCCFCVSLAHFNVSCSDRHALLNIFQLYQLNIKDILWCE